MALVRHLFSAPLHCTHVSLSKLIVRSGREELIRQIPAIGNVSVNAADEVITPALLNNRSTLRGPIHLNSLTLVVRALVLEIRRPKLLREMVTQDSQDLIGTQNPVVHQLQVFLVRHLGEDPFPKVWNLPVVATTLDLTVPNRKVGGTNVSRPSTRDMLGRRRP